MADFCFQCSIDLFFDPPGDMAGLSTKEDTAAGLYCLVICEGCGVTQVDHEGWCIAKDCMHQHGAPGGSEVYESAYRQWKARSGRLGWFLRLRDTVLGSPWSPGLIHCDPRWSWWYSLARAIYHGYPLTVYTEGHSVTVFDNQFNPANLEMAFYGSLSQDRAGKEPAATGTRPSGEDDQGPAKSGVVRDEDFGPL